MMKAEVAGGNITLSDIESPDAVILYLRTNGFDAAKSPFADGVEIIIFPPNKKAAVEA